MASELPGITLKPIGIVRSELKQAGRRDVDNVCSEIVVDSYLSEALDNLDEFSHIIVIYWMHRSVGPSPIKVRPKKRPELPLMGVFATRSPNRPNPLGKATVRLLQRRGNILKVKGLDAIDGTPVIDIKPYIPGYDSVKRAKAPSWVVKQ
ncbi:tRNA (N6-threonylcarbamoyladenosine(37)-N6)-methyltransferase TrmO [Chloroflexota bacterium]